MTPQEAQKLLDAATPGPWGVESGVAGAAVYSKVGVVCDGTGVDDAPLIAAAPELAVLIAGLRYEYAVQVPVATAVPGEPVWRFFVRRGTNGGAILTAVPGLGKWDTSERAAEKRAELHELTGYRIVRRLMSDVEVVE